MDQSQEVLDIVSGRKPIMISMDAEDLLKIFVVFLAAVFLGTVLAQIAIGK
jgi:hypothetical protein